MTQVKSEAVYFCPICEEWYGLKLYNLEQKMCLECSDPESRIEEK